MPLGLKSYQGSFLSNCIAVERTDASVLMLGALDGRLCPSSVLSEPFGADSECDLAASHRVVKPASDKTQLALLSVLFSLHLYGGSRGRTDKTQLALPSVLLSPPPLRRQQRKIPGGGNGNPLQYSCLENLRDRGAWWATVHGVTKKSDTSQHTHTLLRQNKQVKAVSI